VEGEGLLIELIGEFGIAALESEITEADAGEGSEFSIGLGGDGLFVVVLCGGGVAGDVGEVGEGEESLRVARVRGELGHKTLESDLGILRFALIDLDLCFAEESVAGGDGAGVLDEDGVERGEVAFCRGGGKGLGGGEVLLLLQLAHHEDAAEEDGPQGDDGEDLRAVTVDRVDDSAGFAHGDGIDRVEVLRFLIVGGLLRGFCHGLGWVGKKGPLSLRQRRPEA
jgi:hypothetical protein